MDRYQGVFPVPNAHRWIERAIGSSYAFLIVGSSALLFATIVVSIFFYTAGNDVQYFIYAIIIEILLLIRSFQFYRVRTADKMQILNRFKDKEIIFSAEYIEFAATILTIPTPDGVLTKPSGYLRVFYKDISSVQVVAKLLAKTPPYIILHLIDKTHVTIQREMFRDVEPQFFDALKSHEVAISTPLFEKNS